jgi:hypothetical protein
MAASRTPATTSRAVGRFSAKEHLRTSCHISRLGRQRVNTDDRILLLDLENLGSATLRPRPLRARLATLLAAAGEHHHAVAAYAIAEGEPDPVASLLAELRIAPLCVRPGPDAAELALLAHARYVHAQGGRIFLVGSADGRFAELVALGRVELLVWDGQPVSTKLADVVHDIHRLTRPAGTPVESFAGPNQFEPESARDSLASTVPATFEPRGNGHQLAARLLNALVTGFAIAAGQRLFDALSRRAPSPFVPSVARRESLPVSTRDSR